MRRAEREQRIAEVAALNEQTFALARLHAEDFPAPERPTAQAEGVDRDEVVRRHEAEALAGISVFSRSARKVAREQAQEAADRELAERLQRSEEERAAKQQEIDAAWRRLVEGDPETVLEVLEEAFEDNELPAAALDYTGDHVFLLVSVPAPDSLVPEHKVDQTAAGNLTVKKRTKTESNAMYLAILASAMAATAKEAFAVAPSAQKGTVVGVRKDDTSQEIAPLYLAEMDRGDLTRLGPGIDDIGQFFDRIDAIINVVGRTRELRPLAFDAAPGLGDVLERVTTGLGFRLAEGPARKRKADAGWGSTGSSPPLVNRSAGSRGGTLAIPARDVPIVGEDAFFVTCEEERHAARTEAQTSTDDAVRLEATLTVTHLLQWQTQTIDDMLENLDNASSSAEMEEARDWLVAWLDAAQPEFQEWGAFQKAMVDYLGQDVAEQVAVERAEPRLEAVREKAKEDLAHKVQDLGADLGLQLGASKAEQPETKICPDCAEGVKAAARKCRFCGYQFDPETGAA